MIDIERKRDMHTRAPAHTHILLTLFLWRALIELLLRAIPACDIFNIDQEALETIADLTQCGPLHSLQGLCISSYKDSELGLLEAGDGWKEGSRI